jgi:hypothetical protein
VITVPGCERSLDSLRNVPIFGEARCVWPSQATAADADIPILQ